MTNPSHSIRPARHHRQHLQRHRYASVPLCSTRPCGVGGWQALFEYSCGLWVRSGDKCLGGWLETNFQLWVGGVVLGCCMWSDAMAVKIYKTYNMSNI